MHRKLRSWLALAAIPLLATCGNEVVGVVELIQTIEVTPGNPVLSALGLTQLFTATARDKDGNILNGKEFTWSSSAPGIATIDPQTGFATSEGNGLARITATAEGVSGSADLNVDQVVTDVSVTEPPGPITALGASISLSATATDAGGSTVSDVSTLWSSSDSSVVTVSATGVATAIANGVAIIAATADGVTDSISIEVTQVTSALGLVTQPSPTAVTGVAFEQQPTIMLVDDNGNNVAEGGVLVTASLSSGSGSLTGTLNVSTDAAGLASFTDLAISGTGPHVLAFQTSGLSPTTSNTVALTPGATDPSHSTTNLGTGTTAGNPVAVSIQARDAANNPVTVGGDNVSVTITGPNASAPSTVDNGNGLYSATYTPTSTGTDIIQITMNGNPIAGSPFSFTVDPGPLNAVSSSATVPNGTAGALTPIVIQSRDTYGNTLNSGGAAATLTVTGANAATVPVTDNGDGTYSASYTPGNQGTDNVAIALDGTPISGSPFTSLVAAGNADPTQSTATAPTTTTAGATVALTIITRDATGNTLPTGGEVVAISISGANSVTPAVTDAGDGTYTGSYTPSAAGADVITITLNGAEISGSPYALSVNPGPVDPTQSTATVPTFATANVSTPVVVIARDAFGNQQSGGGESVAVAVSGANVMTPTISDEGTGRYLTSYTPTNAGMDVVDITINGSPIAGSPFNTLVEAGGPDPSQSSATVSGTLSAGTISNVEITARDISGNTLTTGGASVAVVVSGANSATPAVTDNGDGTYSAAYIPTVTGLDNVSITLNGSSIGGGPYSTSITPGPVDASISIAVVPGGIVAGNASNISVTTRDAFGNQLVAGGVTVEVSVTGSNTATPVVTDNGDGTYSASYTPVAAGADIVTVLANGSPVASSPFSTVISSGAADPVQSSASLPGTMTAGGTINILVTTRDPNGNALSVGGEFVSVSVSGANTASPSVTDNGDGTYSASYVPTAAGTDTVAVSLNGAAISGSPFSATINPGNAVGAASTASVPGTGTSETPMNILIQARDGFGNAVSIGGATVSVNISGANAATPTVLDAGDGTYNATYTPTLAGTDFIAIALNGVAVSGSPFNTTIAPGSADASQSSANVPTSVVAGDISSLSIQAHDANGNALTNGGATVLVVVSGSNSAAPTVTDNGDGSYSASYTPTTSGTDNVSVTLNGAAVNGTPFSTTVHPGAPDASESVATVPIGVAGATTNISMQARDQFGNNVTAGGATVTIGVSGANNASPSVVDAGNGTYTASYTPTTSGTDNISISVNGTPLPSSPFASTVTPGTVNPAQSTASVPTSGAVGNQTSITIQARDGNGNAILVGGETVVVTVSGANTATPNVNDLGDGTYATTYTPTLAGTDNVVITLNGSPVSGSPFAITISAGAPDASQTTATVPSSGTAGAASNITVTARDAGGNPLTTGGATVVVSVTGANNASPSVTDNDDGTYSTGYTPTTVGSDNIAITLNGSAIGGSPFGSTVLPGTADPGNTSATVPAGTAGSNTNITVQARDAFGNALASGGATVAITVSGANAASPVVTDVGNGTYTAEYTPTTAGSDNVAITLNGGTIDGSPYASVISPGLVSAGQTTANVPDPGEVGSPSNITVQARDANGNALTSGGATVVVTISGSNSASPTVTDEGDGTYTAQYTPTATGVDNVAITLNDDAISGSPFASSVNAASANASQSTANVPTTGTAGAPTAITVQARDGSGNPVTSGGATVVVTVSGANSASPTVTDVGDGTYTASYTPTTAGSDNVTITLNGGTISGSPYGSVVSPGSVSAGQSTANVPDPGEVGSPSNITVQARDANGNPLTSGGATVAIAVTGNNSATPTVTDEGDGTYTAQYTPTATGADNIAITLNSDPIAGSPFASTVNAGSANASQSTASVPSTGTAGAPIAITVQARDGSGNPVTSGGATVVIAVSGANAATPTVTDVGDGTYTASYTPSAAGGDNIAITLDGGAISGSPFASTIAPGSVNAAQSTASVPNGSIGVATDITVQARDANGNALATGGETVVVTVTGSNSDTPAVTDRGDGTYTTSYTPTNGGSDDVAITLNGTPISGSPYTSAVAGGVDPSQSTASVPAAGTPGIATLITVQARDAIGNPIATGGEAVVITISGANTASPTVTDVGDGTYTSSYTPGSVGTDDIDITMNGAVISGSPFTSIVTVDNTSDPSNTFAIIPNGTPGDVTTLTVRARDAADNNVTTGGAAVAITISGTNSASPAVADNGDGTYTATYTPSSAGSDDIAITLNGTPIEGSPYTSTVSTIVALTGKISYERLPSAFDLNSDVIVMNEDGTGMVNLTNNTNFSDERPGISPDGTKIVFNSDRDGDQDIYVMNSNGSNVVQLTDVAGRDRLPVWSPDGTKILFLSERDGDSDIWVMNADGSGATALTINSVDDYQADWSPDGTQIAFYASDGGDFEVFTMDADGTNRTVILDLPDSREVEVSWGLGGIAFISDMDTGGFPNPTQIYKIQPDGTGLTRLTNNTEWDYMPEWSSDGTRIVFITGRDGNGGEIYVMNADGTNQTRITTDSGAEWAPKFQY